ncbi:unnamed protein product [Cuscuta campestris]|uniref:Retrotransposon gag domain-containing protein n=1 Tax=Cuscuta campestris TaxID=132261 RepID=A0A484N0Z4_9ASTE|nr:unnamed protein product [Cuscuta campestris]
MVQTRSNVNQPTGSPPRGETSATGVQRGDGGPNPNPGSGDDVIGAQAGGKAGPAASEGRKKKKTRRSQKKKATKPNGEAMIEDDRSRQDEEVESSSFERASDFNQLGDPKQEKPQTSAFDRLQDNRGSIEEWKDLAHKFLEHFASSRRPKLPYSHLLNVKIQKGEQLWEFINRWEKEARDVQGADDQALTAMLQAAPPGDVRNELRQNPLPTHQEMLARVQYLALEEDDDDETPAHK